MSFVFKEVVLDPILNSKQYVVGHYESTPSIVESGFGSEESRPVVQHFVRAASFTRRGEAEDYCHFLNGGLRHRDTVGLVDASKYASRTHDVVSLIGFLVGIITLGVAIITIKVIQL